MSDTPNCGLYPPPPGIIANCTSPDTQTANHIALHSIMMFLTTISLLIRLYTRYFILQSIELDDYLCVFGFILLIAYSALLLACGNIYAGHHIWDIPKTDFIYGHKLELVAQWLYCIIAPTLKLAVLWLYRRIFGPQTRINYAVNGGIIFNIIAYTALLFISLLSCLPLKRRWNLSVDVYCLPSGVTAYLSGAINVLTDGFVVLLPIPVIWKLNMAFSSKIRASAVFSLGIIVLALSITRLAQTPSIFTKVDVTWELSKLAVYSILELYFGLMCVCFLASPSFIDRFGPSLLSRIRSYTSSVRYSSTVQTQDAPLQDLGNDTKTAEFDDVASTKWNVPFHHDHNLDRNLDIALEQNSTTSLRPTPTINGAQGERVA